MLMQKQPKDEALGFLNSQPVGILSTVNEGQPQSAFVHYICSPEFVIYFMTLKNSRKHMNVQANHHVAFTVGTLNPPKTVQLEGVVELVTDTEELKNFTSGYMDIVLKNEHYAPPITKLNAADGSVVYKIVPSWVRWSDFTGTKKEGMNGPTIVLMGN